MNQRIEKEIQNKLAILLNGKTEISVPSGRIDILTNNELIEVKSCIRWKEGVGQLISYSQYYPNHKLRLHLFGTPLSKFNVIAEQCFANDIILTYELTGYGVKEELPKITETKEDYARREDDYFINLISNWLSDNDVKVIRTRDIVKSISEISEVTDKKVAKYLQKLNWRVRRTSTGSIWSPKISK